MFSILLKTRGGDILATGAQVNFVDNPTLEGGGFAGGTLTILDRSLIATHEFNIGTAYVMNDAGKTVATYHLLA